jgi:spermidine synthase
VSVEFRSWLVDQVTPYEVHLFRREGDMLATRTQFQAIEYVRTEAYGNILVLDGAVQSAEFDEYLYHEALVHPAMVQHPHPERVLIIGGGEGATLRESLKHPSVKSVVMVDIDGELVEFCKKEMPTWHCGAFDDARVTLLHEDGRAFLENSDATYDVIIVDITDGIPDGPAASLYTQEFYQLCRDRLTSQGVIAVQAFALSLDLLDEHATIARTIASVFPGSQSYSTFVPSFIAAWGFVLASKTGTGALDAASVAERLETRQLGDRLKAYDDITHRGYFSLPKAIRQSLAMDGEVLKDVVVVVVEPVDSE